ncbi:M20 metallopeptidase family protein [Viridibacillus arvi]|uniref:M20 metallopeptidase family protein n=1 Tax=Viridibacillus arvi TaxID=263475 RepID=UPI003D03B9A7
MNLTNLHQIMVNYRRHFHQYPEVSYDEINTRKYIIKELEKLELKPFTFSGKDVAVEIAGQQPGKTVIIRADMDALPVFEETGLPFSSKIDGVMHACGHDGHMAILLGLIHYFKEHPDKIIGKIRFLFQHAEEDVPAGAIEVVKSGGLKDADAIFGFHLWEPLELGKIGVRSGPTMAGCDKFTLTIFGNGGHGSMPNETVDPTIIAAQFITQIQTIISRSLHPLEQAVISIGELKSGTNYNVIPDTAYIAGTVRQFGKEIAEKIHNRMDKIISGLCESFGAKYQLEYLHGDPTLVNDDELYKMLKKNAIQLFGEKRVEEITPILGSEDFSNYTEVIPGMYTYIGIGRPGETYGHHHPKFDIDESMLVPAATLISQSVIHFLAGEEKSINLYQANNI